ncbi:MAG: hypothetical protein IKE53_09780 [Clostridiales bacterium]|nr:hypothetical protein [Clostridiales bacterium]
MNKNSLSVIQIVIAALALIYMAAPDLLFGPLDDMGVATLAVIIDSILQVVKGRLDQTVRTNEREEEPDFKDAGSDPDFHKND